MPLLAYCLVEAQASIVLPQPGVGGASIETVSAAGLSCLASWFESSGPIGRTSVRAAALDFHRVLRDVLQQVAIVPFRFPTVMADPAELSNFLREHQAEYAKALLRLRTVVQMEILVEPRSPASPARGKPSGAEYLRLRKAEHDSTQAEVNNLHSQLQDLVAGWRCRETMNGIRCYALVQRGLLDAFGKRAGRVQSSTRYTARITGPWPATEFLDLT